MVFPSLLRLSFSKSLFSFSSSLLVSILSSQADPPTLKNKVCDVKMFLMVFWGSLGLVLGALGGFLEALSMLLRALGGTLNFQNFFLRLP